MGEGIKNIVAISSDFFSAFAKIPRKQQAKVVEFITKFRTNPMSNGINYEKIRNASDENMRSVRIDNTYRGIILKPDEGNVFLLLWVDHHDEAYDWAKRKKCVVNKATGAIQVFDTIDHYTELEEAVIKSKGLFDNYKDEDLSKLGVLSEILSSVRKIMNIDELDKMKENLPLETYEALTFLADGFGIDEIISELFENISDEKKENMNFESALKSPWSKASFIRVDEENKEKEMMEILAAPLEKWRVFLHPSQRKLVESNMSGSYRVLGGAGTGKTVVAIHRAKNLAEQSLNTTNNRILFTTFTVNLASDIKENLKKICPVDAMKNIEVVNLDRWVSDFLKKSGYNYEIVYGNRLDKIWEQALAIAPTSLGFTDSFYKDEWNKVIKTYDISSKIEYLKSSRVGRGVRLDRKDRILVWNVFEEFKNIMNEYGVRDIETAISDATSIAVEKNEMLMYDSIIVDEGQDFSMQAYKLLRAIVGYEHPNDIFVVGDAHQRIYGKNVVLSQCGINIRGRSKILKINYRTTEETRRWAFRLLNGVKYDDLDNGIDDGKGYKSLMHGQEPYINIFSCQNDEVKYVAEEINQIIKNNGEMENICIVARTKKLLSVYKEILEEKGIRTYEIKRTKIDERTIPGVRMATMHRVKGLEFNVVFIVGMNDGIMPLSNAINSMNDNLSIQEAENAEKALLYVAATRAKKVVYISGFGKLSKFIDSNT